MYLGQLSGLVPLVGVNAGYCFAGNAAILGCCDVVIATEDSNIGMGGPAMIEGGGLGVFAPTEVGPMSVQKYNGVVDIAVADEAEAVAVAKKYLSYFQGRLDDWEAPDQRELRHVIPEDRKRSYDVRAAIDGLFDVGSVLELRRDFGLGMVTALARVRAARRRARQQPQPPRRRDRLARGGQAARFLQLCDAFDIPVVTLVDTPG
jgi:acetyl-CoA carboxylase carboxyltransferase component